MKHSHHSQPGRLIMALILRMVEIAMMGWMTIERNRRFSSESTETLMLWLTYIGPKAITNRTHWTLLRRSSS
jgi:hypothetical protein